MNIEVPLSSNLSRGKLLSELGGTALIYEGLYRGNPVVVKQAREARNIPIIQSEHNFLLSPPKPITATLTDYGIPSDWKAATRFVHLIPEATTKEMVANGVIALEKVAGQPLVRAESEETNLNLPLKFHFAAILGWVDMLKQLRQQNITMDSNIDTDLLLSVDPNKKILNVVRIDCATSAGLASDKSLIPGLTQEQSVIDQMIEIITRNYSRDKEFGKFMGYSIPALVGRFREGVITDTDTFFSALLAATSRADWNDDFIKRGDDVRLEKLAGISF